MTRISLIFILYLVAAAAATTSSSEKKKKDQNIHILHLNTPNKQLDNPEIVELYLPSIKYPPQHLGTEALPLKCKDTKKDTKKPLPTKKCDLMIKGICIIVYDKKNIDRNRKVTITSASAY